ncbi:MAG: hypothetical protein B6U72_05190 [Candidatus Altiarchaeales archaeon ex4484_2]|nr:MAG: hypothetical protein B6U72_05190 [Candidatus Altiarchaeales archaeon ex4484_2]
MSNEDAAILEERIFQLEKVFFTGLELLIGTAPESLDDERIEELFTAYERVISKEYESDEEFKKAVHERNKKLEEFREYVIENFNREGDFDRKHKEIRQEALEILLGVADVDGKETTKLYGDLQKFEDKNNVKKIRERLSELDPNSLVGNLAAAYKNKELVDVIADSAESVSYYSQLCTPFLKESRLAELLSEVGAVVTELYFGLCVGEINAFSSVIGEVNKLVGSKKHDI